MAIIATPARRRIAMAVLLLLAVAGGFIRQMAPEHSTLRDIGTLLLVLWLPAVGNLIAWLIRQIPRKPAAPQLPSFAAGSAFVPHFFARLQPVPGTTSTAPHLGRPECMLVVGGQAFTARLQQPVGDALAATQPQAIELLRPEAARARLAPGTAFHVLVGSTAVARGEVSGWSS